MRKHFFISFILLLMLSGCNKVTKENYDKIKTGMMYDDVVALIGEPEGCSSAIGISSCQWKNGEAMISITLINNEVSIVSAKDLK